MKYLAPLTLALLLAACGGGSEPTALSSTGPVERDEQPAEQPAAEPVAPSQPTPEGRQEQPVQPTPEPVQDVPAPTPTWPQLVDGMSATLDCVRGNNGDTPRFLIVYDEEQTTNFDLGLGGSDFTYDTAPADASIELHGDGVTYSWWLNADGSEQTWTTLDGDAAIVGWGIHGAEPDLFVVCGVATQDVEGVRNR